MKDKLLKILNEILENRNIQNDLFKKIDEHMMFRKVSELIVAEPFDLELDWFIQKLDSDENILHYIRFIDFYFKYFEKYLSREEIKSLVEIIFNTKDLSSYKFPEVLENGSNHPDIINFYIYVFGKLGVFGKLINAGEVDAK